jgi:1-phosphofructokinase/tagatose 6-phosphate kinase
MRKPSFITVCLNPTLQKTLVFPSLLPDAVNRCSGHRFDVSGKGINVCRVLTQLGKENIHLTQLGGSFRPVFLDLCNKDNLNIKWVESHSAIRFCYTVIDKEKHQVTELVEEGAMVGEGAEAGILEAFDSLLPDYSALIISGTKAQGFSNNLFPELVKRAKKCGLFVILDIRGQDLLNSLPYKPDIIKPNLQEFSASFTGEKFGFCPEDREKTAGLCREIREQYGCRIILTRGSQSLWFADAGGLEEFPVESVEALNPIGSGDAFAAGFGSALLEGAAFREALAEGVRCGRLNALQLKPGSLF